MVGRIVGEGAKQRYYLDGREVTKAEFKKAFPDRKVCDAGGDFITAWKRPIQSDAMAVHPDQIDEAMARNRKHGVFVEYNPEDGRPILRDRGQRRDLMRIEGFHDKHGGYGDDH